MPTLMVNTSSLKSEDEETYEDSDEDSDEESEEEFESGQIEEEDIVRACSCRPGSSPVTEAFLLLPKRRGLGTEEFQSLIALLLEPIWPKVPI